MENECHRPASARLLKIIGRRRIVGHVFAESPLILFEAIQPALVDRHKAGIADRPIANRRCLEAYQRTIFFEIAYEC